MISLRRYKYEVSPQRNFKSIYSPIAVFKSSRVRGFPSYTRISPNRIFGNKARIASIARSKELHLVGTTNHVYWYAFSSVLVQESCRSCLCKSSESTDSVLLDEITRLIALQTVTLGLRGGEFGVSHGDFPSIDTLPRRSTRKCSLEIAGAYSLPTGIVRTGTTANFNCGELGIDLSAHADKYDTSKRVCCRTLYIYIYRIIMYTSACAHTDTIANPDARTISWGLFHYRRYYMLRTRARAHIIALPCTFYTHVYIHTHGV